MGMFDYVKCEMPLPGTLPTWIGSEEFQTKDTPAQYLETYTIKADRSFDGPDAADFTGDVEFYANNVRACGPGIYTKDGEDAEYVTFLARIVAGKVIELTQTEYERKPALSTSAMRSFPMPSEDDVAYWKKRYAEPIVGERKYVLWGGQDKGYWAECVASGRREHCFKTLSDDPESFKHAGDLELIDHSMRDHIFWDTEEEALANHKKRRDEWDEERKKYDDHVASKEASN